VKQRYIRSEEIKEKKLRIEMIGTNLEGFGLPHEKPNKF
jgi:hypothetical protein